MFIGFNILFISAIGVSLVPVLPVVPIVPAVVTFIYNIYLATMTLNQVQSFRINHQAVSHYINI